MEQQVETPSSRIPPYFKAVVIIENQNLIALKEYCREKPFHPHDHFGGQSLLHQAAAHERWDMVHWMLKNLNADPYHQYIPADSTQRYKSVIHLVMYNNNYCGIFEMFPYLQDDRFSTLADSLGRSPEQLMHERCPNVYHAAIKARQIYNIYAQIIEATNVLWQAGSYQQMGEIYQYQLDLGKSIPACVLEDSYVFRLIYCIDSALQHYQQAIECYQNTKVKRKKKKPKQSNLVRLSVCLEELKLNISNLLTYVNPMKERGRVVKLLNDNQAELRGRVKELATKCNKLLDRRQRAKIGKGEIPDFQMPKDFWDYHDDLISIAALNRRNGVSNSTWSAVAREIDTSLDGAIALDDGCDETSSLLPQTRLRPDQAASTSRAPTASSNLRMRQGNKKRQATSEARSSSLLNRV